MSIFNQFPWTNFQNLNLDWCIRTVQDCKEIVDAALADVSNAVAMYFTDHIDTTLSVSGKAADAAVTGNRLTTIQNSVPSVDTTLSVAGAAADAATVGNDLTVLTSRVNAFSNLEYNQTVLTDDGGSWAYQKGDYTKAASVIVGLVGNNPTLDNLGSIMYQADPSSPAQPLMGVLRNSGYVFPREAWDLEFPNNVSVTIINDGTFA